MWLSARILAVSSTPAHDSAPGDSFLESLLCSGNFEGDEAIRLSILKLACILGAPMIDIELKASKVFFDGEISSHAESHSPHLLKFLRCPSEMVPESGGLSIFVGIPVEHSSISFHLSIHQLEPVSQLVRCASVGFKIPTSTKVIVSHHDFDKTPTQQELDDTVREMWECGADIVKIAAMAQDITDSNRMLNVLRSKRGKVSIQLHLRF